MKVHHPAIEAMSLGGLLTALIFFAAVGYYIISPEHKFFKALFGIKSKPSKKDKSD